MGLLLTFIGLQTSKVVVAAAETMVTMGDLLQLEPLLAISGLAIISALHFRCARLRSSPLHLGCRGGQGGVDRGGRQAGQLSQEHSSREHVASLLCSDQWHHVRHDQLLFSVPRAAGMSRAVSSLEYL